MNPLRLTRSLDHLLGAGEHRWRHVEAEHPCGLEVDHELELARQYDGQLRWLITLEGAAGLSADLTPCIRNVGSVAHQSADFDNFTGVRHQSF